MPLVVCWLWQAQLFEFVSARCVSVVIDLLVFERRCELPPLIPPAHPAPAQTA